MIPDEVVERVREAADAVAIIGEQVKLRRVGSSFRGPCPFHQGKNPNFAVNLPAPTNLGVGGALSFAFGSAVVCVLLAAIYGVWW